MAWDNKELARRWLDEVFNKGNTGYIEQNGDPSLTTYDPLMGRGDIKAAKLLVQGYRSAFPDLQLKVEAIIGEGDMVCLRWSASGTHRGSLAGIAPTQKRAQVSGLSLMRFREGKLVEDFGIWDVPSLLNQLGVAGKLGMSVGAAPAEGAQRPQARP